MRSVPLLRGLTKGGPDRGGDGMEREGEKAQEGCLVAAEPGRGRQEKNLRLWLCPDRRVQRPLTLGPNLYSKAPI